jgi:outer membrane protein, multidrug efflux system
MYNKLKYRGWVLFAGLLVIGFTSCRTGKNIGELNNDTEGLYRVEEEPADTTTIADIPWEEYFRDETLKSLIREGLDNNFDLRIAGERIKQAEASVKMARAALWPALGLAAETEYTRYSNGDNGKDVLGYDSNTLSFGFTASWEIDAWGKLNSKKKAQLASFMGSYEYSLYVRTNLIASIGASYYSLMALDQQLQITEETVELLKKSAATMEALKDAGLQNGAAVEQSNALLYKTQLSIPDIENQIRQQENTICLLLGRKPGPVERGSIEDQEVPKELKYGVPAQLLAKRPDVKQAELTFRSAYELTNAAQASLYPSINISSASLGYKGDEFSNFFKPENIAAMIVGGIAQPLFNKRQLRSNLEIAQSQQRETALAFEKTVLSAGKEVSNILFGFQSSVSKNELREKQIESLGAAVDFTQDLLKAGEANYTEVLSAQQNLLSSQLGKVNDKLEQLTYCVDLYKALGGGY